MATQTQLEPFIVSPDDPLADAHAAVATWVEDAFSSLGAHRWWYDADPKELASGRRLLEAKPVRARNYVLAAIAQVRHWDLAAAKIRNAATSEYERINAHTLPGWGEVWGRRRHAERVVRALMRRALPFTDNDLRALLDWCNEMESLDRCCAPVSLVSRALEHFLLSAQPSGDLGSAIKQFARRLRTSADKGTAQIGIRVEQLYRGGNSIPSADLRAPIQPPPVPAPTGIDGVLAPLKALLGMGAAELDASATAIGADRFPLGERSPLRPEHRCLVIF